MAGERASDTRSPRQHFSYAHAPRKLRPRWRLITRSGHARIASSKLRATFARMSRSSLGLALHGCTVGRGLSFEPERSLASAQQLSTARQRSLLPFTAVYDFSLRWT